MNDEQRPRKRERPVWFIEPSFSAMRERTEPDLYADIETMRSFDVKGAPALEE